MFGNVTELKDLALPPVEEIKKYKVEDSPRSNDDEDFKFDNKDVGKLLALIPVDPKERKYAYETLEFNAIMESLSKMVAPKTRRWWRSLTWPNLSTLIALLTDAIVSIGKEAVTLVTDGASSGWDVFQFWTTPYTGYDTDYYRGREDSADWRNFEYEKLTKLDKLMICLLIHTRYRVDHAIRQRSIKPAFRVVHANYGWKTVRWYEKMIHLDQDLRDLCTLILETADEAAPVPNWNPRELHLQNIG